MSTAFITGASTGIGFAAATQLARAGHDVIATMRNPDRSPQLQELAAKEGLPIEILALDVDSDASVAKAFAEAAKLKGEIDILVNNAGVAHPGATEDLDLDVFRQDMETNYFGALRCTKAVLTQMRERGSGCIINVTSILGQLSFAAHAPYCASKWALEAATEALAQEVASFNVRVAIVEPGVIATQIFNKVDDLSETPYAGQHRLLAFFAASLTAVQVPAELVGDKIVEIVESDAPALRHPVGPDAEPFFAWRDSMTDEEWIALAALDEDEAWAVRIEEASGLDVRPFLGKTSVGIVPS
ncbi:MAG TPA: SDR family oxidoreductase [Dehalococcoidia bacterium]|nr:SDR family oxidoreductase [Dehalococcoidia bacterium]